MQSGAQTGTQLRKCDNCGRMHPGECRWSTGACFKCGKIGHHIGQCPEITKEAPVVKPTNQQQKPKSNARVFALTQREAEPVDDAVTGITLIKTILYEKI